MGRKRKRRPGEPTGILLISKPRGPTSREVVEQVEKRLGLRGLGHCGTLDPLATGLLVLVCGRASRLQDRLTGHDKSYRAEIRLGARSATDDAEGPIVAAEPPPAMPDRPVLEAALAAFEGWIEQTPPAHSAIRVGGERLWKKARRGDTVEIPSRQVRIDRIELLDWSAPDAVVDVDCGSGTYIRSLARDLGERLGAGGYLTGLERRRSGLFELDRAVAPEAVEIADLLDLETALADSPRALLAPEDAALLLSGRPVEHRGSADLEEDALVWLNDRIIGRAKRLTARTFRLRRIVIDPSEDPSVSGSDSDRMSAPPQGDRDR